MKDDPANEPRDELERRLARLAPAPPEARFQGRLGAELDAREMRRRLVTRFLPLAAAACLVLAGAWLARQHFAGTVPGSAHPAQAGLEPGSAVPPPAVGFVRPPLVTSGIPEERFLPVSAQEFLREAAPGGVIRLSGEVPARELRVAYEQAWHWHDPDTRTNIRVFQPREEILLVPLHTD